MKKQIIIVTLTLIAGVVWGDASLGEAIGASQYDWSTFQQIPWTVDTSEGLQSSTCLISGNDGSVCTSWLKAKVKGPCQFSYFFKFQTYNGSFKATCDDEVWHNYTGTISSCTTWYRESHVVPAGTHIVTFAYLHPGTGYTTTWNGVKLDGVSVTMLEPDPPSWTYVVSNGVAHITGGANLVNDLVVPATLDGYQVVSIDPIFQGNEDVTSITFSDGIVELPAKFAADAVAITNLVIPASLLKIGSSAFAHSPIQTVTFYGFPAETEGTDWCTGWKDSVVCHATLQSAGPVSAFFGRMPIIDDYASVKIVSSELRKTDASLMDVVYRVTSSKSSVRVRSLAFENGERSFATVVRPMTFVEGTSNAVGNAVEPNVNQKLTWQISQDWGTDLAKVSFDVLAKEDDTLLPLTLTTIPGRNGHVTVQVSVTELSESLVMNALYWLYADRDADLILEHGVLMAGGKVLAVGNKLSDPAAAAAFVLGKMGFSVLSGTDLVYVREALRKSLLPEGVRQYGIKQL